MAGRPRKSEAEKRAKGTLQKCRENRQQLQVNGSLPEAPPPGLTADARAAWKMAVTCAPRGALSPLSHSLLERWCRNYALYRKLAKKVEAGDIEQVHPESGMRSLTPTFAAMVQAQKLMAQCEKELGFTPLTINRLSSSEDTQEQDDEYSEFM